MSTIKLTTNRPETLETILDLIQLIKFAKDTLDIDLRIDEFSDKSETELVALNNVILEEVNREIEKEMKWLTTIIG